MAASEAATSSSRSSDKDDKKTAKAAGGAHVPALPGVHLPTGTAGRVVWWGGLATVAAVGVVDWPVAALIGVGSWVAEQYAKTSRQPQGTDRKAA